MMERIPVSEANVSERAAHLDDDEDQDDDAAIVMMMRGLWRGRGRAREPAAQLTAHAPARLPSSSSFPAVVLLLSPSRFDDLLYILIDTRRGLALASLSYLHSLSIFHRASGYH